MIAMVRIAGLERWCPTGKRYIPPGITPAVGATIGIETDRVRMSPCGGRFFKVARLPKDVGVIDRFGTDVGDYGWVCEHQLELGD